MQRTSTSTFIRVPLGIAVEAERAASFSLRRRNFGQPLPAIAAASVPGPGAIRLAIRTLVALFWARRVALALGCLGLVLLGGDSARAVNPALRIESSELSSSIEPLMDLEAGWKNPPAIARVHCWWWWLNGQTDIETITRDLEAMQAKGFGGANLIDAAHASSGQNAKPPHGPDFGSPEWRKLFLHALREADRLGLQLGLNIQSGWNLGGPTVTAEQAAKKIVWSEQEVAGGKRIEIVLPATPLVGNYGVEVAVLALPLPADGNRKLARIENFRQKAYHEYPGGFTAVDASHLAELGDTASRGSSVAVDQVRDLSTNFRDGVLRWDAPPGRWLVLRFAYTLSGAKVSTSSDNWNGWAIDYLDPAAFAKYCDDVLSPMLDEAGPLVGKSLRFLHTDSWELGPVNWTPKLRQEFQSRRQYDPTPYLPTIAGYVIDDAERSTQFLNDFRRTIADLIAAGKYQAFATYAHRRGLGIHPESGGPHAAPVDALLCLAHNDIPMGEFWARSQTHRVSDEQRFFVKQPASAAHIYGRRVVMAEAFTTIGPHWEKDPGELKPDFDRMACEGLNLVMWHTFDSSPRQFGVPGNAYFAGTHLNPNVTWWNHSDEFFAYLNRCQFLLQQGLPVADVLYFYGENVPSFVRLESDDPAELNSEFHYDVINLEALLTRTSVRDHRLVLPDGTSYQALALPPDGHYGLSALRRINELVADGARVFGPRPTRSYSRLVDPPARVEFAKLRDRLWPARIRPISAIRSELAKSSGGRDFEVMGPVATAIGSFHRRTAQEDIYFVANPSEQAVRFKARFRVASRRPELWDPVTGQMSATAVYEQHQSHTELALELPPQGSRFVVFRDSHHDDRQHVGDAGVQSLRVLSDIVGSWKVNFPEAAGGCGEQTWDSLSDWTTSSDPRIRYFSGTAVYEQSFDLPACDGQQVIWLDLGEVDSLARVTVNGESLGVVWTKPFRVDATRALRPGQNLLRIEVTNVWHNRLVGDAKLPPAERITRTNIHVDPKRPLRPSGLLGPVRLLVAGPQDDVPADAAQHRRTGEQF